MPLFTVDKQQNRSLLLVTGKIFNVLLEMMCFQIWRYLKHETQKSFTRFLEHTWMTTQAFFLPRSAARTQLCCTCYNTKLFKPEGEKFSQLQKKKRLGEAADLLIPVWGAATNAEDAPYLPCLHKPSVQVQSGAELVNWYPLSGPRSFAFREKYWQPDLVVTHENEQLPRQELTLIFSIKPGPTKISKTNMRIISPLVCWPKQWASSKGQQRIGSESSSCSPQKTLQGWSGVSWPPSRQASLQGPFWPMQNIKAGRGHQKPFPIQERLFYCNDLMVSVYITMEDMVFTWLLLAHQKTQEKRPRPCVHQTW